MAAVASSSSHKFATRFLATQSSRVSARRQPSAIRALMPLLNLPGMISMAGGLPNAAMFPFKSLSFDIAVSPATGGAGGGGQQQQQQHKTITLTSKELETALQYSATPGLPQLLAQLRELQLAEHAPAYDDFSIAVTCGSQDGLTKAFECFAITGDEAEHSTSGSSSGGGGLIVENPTYAGVLSHLQPLGARMHTVTTDEHGIVPESLERLLATWDKKQSSSPPRVLYTIPTGQNPSGSTATTERKLAILALARKYDLLIIEDDPYYFLSYGATNATADTPFKRPLIESYFRLDTDARVLRFDSLSKVLSSGLRLGFVTGPSKLVDRINLHSQATNLHASGVSQALVSKLWQTWGLDGFRQHVNECSVFYQQRRDLIDELSHRHLDGLCSWTRPVAGMFMWYRILDGRDSKRLIEEEAKDALFLMVPGQAFSALNEPSCYVRASFSTATRDEMDTALQRFAALLSRK